MILLRFRAGIYPIMNVFLSIPAQLSCQIKFLSFWVHINAIPICVIITDLYWPPIFQYIITNNDSGRIVVFSNFLRPDFIGPDTESWWYIILSLSETVSISSDCVLVSPLFFRMKYFMSLQ